MESENQNNEPSSWETVKSDVVEEGQEQKEESGGKESEKFSEYRNLAVLGYVLPFLFFLPLIEEKTKKVPYARFHSGQQLNLLILIIALYFASSFLYEIFYMAPFIYKLISLVMQVVYLGVLALIIIGAMQAYKGKIKELPFIGKFKILK